MPDNKNQNYLYGAAILGAAAIVIKILGFIYKIPLGNILGDKGFSHFNVAYVIYNVLLNLSTAGLPVALSKMISEANELNRPIQAKRIFNVGLFTFVGFGLFGSLIMMLFSTELAAMIGDVGAAQSIFVLAPSVVLVCVLSAYRGYMQGHSNMTATSVSQVIEVAVKVVIGLIIAYFLDQSGHSRPEVSAGTMIGVTAGSLAACVYVIIYKKKFDGSAGENQERDIPEGNGYIFRRLIKIAVPITFGASIMSIISLIDAQLVLSRLQSAAGFSYSDATTLYGVYSKTMTFYNLPAALITTPIAISVVPAIAAAIVRGSKKEARTISGSSLRITSTVAMPMAVGIFALSYPIMNVLFPNSASQGPVLLMMMGLASFVACLSLVTTAILQAYGRERLPIFSMVFGGLIKIGVNWFLVANPQINIMGAPVGTICCYLAISLINLWFLQHKMRLRLRLSNIFMRQAINSAIMGIAAWAVYELLQKILSKGGEISFINMAIAMAAGIGVGGIIYLVMTIATRAITMEDMKLIPKGERLAKLLKIK